MNIKTGRHASVDGGTYARGPSALAGLVPKNRCPYDCRSVAGEPCENADAAVRGVSWDEDAIGIGCDDEDAYMACLRACVLRG